MVDSDLQLLLPLAVFAAAMTGTPGPNNMMLTASGANFGFSRTLPHLCGISIGVATLLAMVAAGLGAVLQLFPAVHWVLKAVAAAYLLYLAWRIGSAGPPAIPGQGSAGAHAHRSVPLSFLQALMFQFVNPKAWAMAITAVGSFTIAGSAYWWSALLIIGIFLAVGFPLTSLWAAFGVLLGRALSSPRSWIYFNRCMGVLTAACLFFIW